MHLFGSQQAGERIDQVPLDRSLQVTRPVFQVRPFAQQKFPRRLRDTKQEPSLRRFQNALLHHSQLDFQNLLELLLRSG